MPQSRTWWCSHLLVELERINNQRILARIGLQKGLSGPTMLLVFSICGRVDCIPPKLPTLHIQAEDATIYLASNMLDE